MIESEEFYFTNKDCLTRHDYKKYQTNYLTERNQRLCRKCGVIFNGISDNFHIKKYHQTKRGRVPAYNSWCKGCCSEKNLRIRTEIKADPERYIKTLVPQIRHRAKEVGVPFDLTPEYLFDLFFKVQRERCYFSGEILSFKYSADDRNKPHEKMCSLDRKIPSLGYVEGNVAWVIWKINMLKNDISESDFIKLCETIVDYKSTKQ